MSSLRPAAVQSVAFVGNYPPRQCGLATFTHDVCSAVAERYPSTSCWVCAVTDANQSYEYPLPVRFELAEQEQASYLRAAEFLNLSNVDVVCIQHEYGIYGGEAGAYILDLARAVQAPIVTTLHTILDQPTCVQDRILRELTALSDRVVVMSEHASALLQSTYGVPIGKIDLIPHGIPDMPFVDSSFYKDQLGVEGRFVLLTFGLLSSNKGIEHVIEALPDILCEFPNVVYLVLGVTHPNVLRTEGEAYRNRLKARVEELGLQDAVQFHDRFVEIEELKEFIAAADMYVTPYLNPSQITSGTLAYAFGCGKAVVSTPYLHAVELLAGDNGVLVPFADPKSIAQAVLGLLRDDCRRHAMRKRAYLLGREMIWSEAAAHYVASFEHARRGTSASVAPAAAKRPGNECGRPLPRLRLDHLRRMTDSTGLVQHARFALPHYPEGYCTDDNARALALAVTLDAIFLESGDVAAEGVSARDLINTYASFLNAAFNPETRQFRNFMSYDRQWLDKRGSDDCQGRSMMALGTCIAQSSSPDLRQWAAGLFQDALSTILDATSPRAWASALLGIDAYLVELSGDRAVQHVAGQLEERLMAQFHAAKSSGWPWFEDTLAYENAILPHALIVRGIKDADMLSVGLQSLQWLILQQTSSEGNFQPIGSSGFYPRGGERAQFDQQPIEAAGMVSACLAAFQVTQDPYWSEQARIAFAWFLGHNDIGIAPYDAFTGGCRDGITVDRANRNQGAESTLAYLSARAQMEVLESLQIPSGRLRFSSDGLHLPAHGIGDSVAFAVVKNGKAPARPMPIAS